MVSAMKRFAILSKNSRTTGSPAAAQSAESFFRSAPQLTACALLLCLVLPLAAQRNALSPAKITEIGKAVTAAMSSTGIPGLSVAVGRNQELRWSTGYGMADLENMAPVKAATVHRLGSISKPITAVAAMQLVERGKLDLDAPVQKYVPSFPEKPWPVTSRQLLGHLGGIRHYTKPGEIDSTRHYGNLIEPLKIFADDPLLFEPGTRYSYSTYGYVLLGAVVEAAGGQRFTEYLKEHVFLPAHMNNIRADDVYKLIPNRMRGYRKTPEGEIQNCALADTSNKIPGGGLVSTAEDLVNFALAVGRGDLLKKETVAQMFTAQKTRDGKPTGYGLGWGVMTAEGKRRVGHGGGQQGTSTFLMLLPDDGVAVAIMANLENAGGLAALADRIAKIVMEP